MKKQFVPFAVLLLSMFIYNYADADKKAVAETIGKELKAYPDKDYNTRASCWVHETYVNHTMIGSNFYNYQKSPELNPENDNARKKPEEIRERYPHIPNPCFNS